MPIPPLPVKGETLTFRRVGVTMAQIMNGKRQVRWEDSTCSHTENPLIVSFPTDQRFECTCTYEYTGVYFQTGPAVISDVNPLPPPDKGAARRLWERIMRRDGLLRDHTPPVIQGENDGNAATESPV